ncbi:DUF4365 domain-containing protein [Salinicoccus luteus]|uniref:DUF4365 domain-containing protein n=1 Tax=Salinicoccus luteus TaxID=367840 RepID=UPI000A0461BC|nr:DUF4365 domain-containing protein [Salinicoccus luteus]
MDNIIIEHLACTEVNEQILKPPFHLISNVQWNDKGLAFDGDITLYSKQIKKEEFIGIVPLQIKGTKTFKKKIKKNKIKHNIKKEDLEVYYANGNGVLYIVVTINPNTFKRQAYYRILAPLDLKVLLDNLRLREESSTSILFKKVKNGGLEYICKKFLRIVEKQPKAYIETNLKKEFDEYKIDYGLLQREDNFNFFDEVAYLYGINNGQETPLTVVELKEIASSTEVEVELGEEILNIQYKIINKNQELIFLVENSLYITLDKESLQGKFSLKKIGNLEQFIKALKVLKYIRDYNELPFSKSIQGVNIKSKKDLLNIEENITAFEEIAEVFASIGVNKDYTFNKEENIENLFNAAIKIFKHNQHNMLTNNENMNTKDYSVKAITLSKDLKVIVFYDAKNNKYINFFSEETLNNLNGLLPKDNKKQINDIDIEEEYWRVSIYSNEKLDQLKKFNNFNFDIVKKSYEDKYHDVNSPYTMHIAMDFLWNFDVNNNQDYIEVSNDLVTRFLKDNPEDSYAKINKFQINLRRNGELNEDEILTILEILEIAENNNDNSMRFACEVLLQSKIKAKAVFDSLSSEVQEELKLFPICNLYQKL